jgi:hypothetical protein
MSHSIINIMAEEYYKNWYIKGIAESVLKEIKEDGEDIDAVLDNYLQRTFWTIYSRETDDAKIVVELVRKYIGEMELQTSCKN